MSLTPQILERVQTLYDRGLYLQAWGVAAPHGPLASWTGSRQRVLAGRLAKQIGGNRLGDAIHLRAWRAARSDTENWFYAGVAIATRRGPWAGWKFALQHDPSTIDDVGHRALLHTFRAQTLGILRDFDGAEDCLARAESCAPDMDWVHVVLSFVLEMQDRHAESLEAADRALSLRPGKPVAVVAACRALTALGRDGEAIDRLQISVGETESYQVAGMLAALLVANGDHRAALESLDRVVELAPLGESDLLRRVAMQRSEAHYRCGNVANSIRFAREADTAYSRAIADRLDTNPDGLRVALDVGFVQQHHVTCAPATLTAISRFWSKAAEHLGVAEEICYDGTPAHSERTWAQRHGWITREFTVTRESAVALIDRGVPFTLTTIGATIGHLQAVIGYDACRGTLIIRDPSYRNEIEYGAEQLLEESRSTGPRGMALVPDDRPELLDGLSLPDTDLWDRSYAVQTALAAHDRDGAHDVYRTMCVDAPEHLLTQLVRRSLAAYDNDTVGLLAFADFMLQRFPSDSRLLLSKLEFLSDLDRRSECLELLDEICRRGDGHPSLLVAYAGELAGDARRHAEARKVLGRLLARGHVDSSCLRTLGDIEWNAARTDDALELYRFAACLSDMDESLADGYFTAACQLDRIEDAERFLQTRVRRYGRRSPGPALTLCQAYRQIGEPVRALETLSETLSQHPDDARLQVVASRIYVSHGRLDKAEELLTKAQSGAKRTHWLRAAATLAERRGEAARALDLWREVLESEPLVLEANGEVARLLSSLHGPREAKSHLDDVCTRFPHNLSLQKLRAQWLIRRDRAAAEPALRAMIAASSVNTWARAQLAGLLGDRGEFKEALAEAELAALLDPDEAACHVVLGTVYTLSGSPRRAVAAFREAIRRWVGSEPAIRGWMALCDLDDERREALAWVKREILRQHHPGDAPSFYHGFARGLIGDEELLASLEELRRARPDHRGTWVATIRQLAAMDRPDDVARVGEELAERFPRDVDTWFEVASLCGQLGDGDGERNALERVLRIDPGSGQARRGLSEIARREGDADEARRILDAAVEADPLDALNHGWLAEVAWAAGDHETAIASVEAALRLEPDYEWAWDALHRWSTERGEPEGGVRLARDLTARRAGEVRVWLKLAELLDETGSRDESLAILKHAVKLDPRSLEASDQYAKQLAESGRHDDALRACRSDVWPEGSPLVLKGRAAWIEAHRGNLREGIEQMRRLLASAPDYVWGWKQLVDWYRGIEDPDGYLDCATRLARLTPNEAASFGILGHAREVNNDAEGATKEFRRALELDPDCRFAARRLFELHLERRQLEGAERLLPQLSRALGPVTEAAMRVRLDVARVNETAALGSLRRLCLIRDADEDEVRDAVARVHAGWPRDVNRLLDELVVADACPLVGELWILTQPPARLWSEYRERIDTGLPEPQARRARAQVLVSLAEAKRKRDLDRFFAHYREPLQSDVELWGSALFAAVHLADWHGVVELAGAWSRRDGLRPWMLSNLALALRSLGRHAEATHVSHHAVILEPDGATPRHQAWLAVEEALAGEDAVAGTWLAQLGQVEELSWESFLTKLARAVLASSDGSEGSARDRFREARAWLDAACVHVTDYRKHPALRETYRRCARLIGKRRGGVGRAVWLARSLRG